MCTEKVLHYYFATVHLYNSGVINFSDRISCVTSCRGKNLMDKFHQFFGTSIFLIEIVFDEKQGKPEIDNALISLRIRVYILFDA